IIRCSHSEPPIVHYRDTKRQDVSEPPAYTSCQKMGRSASCGDRFIGKEIPMNAPAKFDEVTLEDKYTLASGRVFLTGTQALVRLPMLQRERDLAAGLNTAGFISGYRGSPLGGLDQSLWKAKKHLETHHIKFQPGVNEDLAATSIWGTQQLNLFNDAKYDGGFSIWYGKGPGVERGGGG